MSKDAIKKFLEDAQNYPDTTMVKIGDQEVPLGSLRTLNSEERTQLSTQLKAAADKEKEINQRQATVLDLAKKAQEAYAAAEEARVKNSAAPPSPSADAWEKDPWLQPVREQLSARDKALEELKKTVTTLLTVNANMAKIYTDDRYEREYSSIDFGRRENKPTREEIEKYAVDNKIVDRHGIPSIRLAWDKMSEADRLAELEKSSFEKGREAGRQEAIASRIPPPNVPGPGVTGALPKTTPGSGDLGDLYSDVMKDPELRELVNQLPPGLLQ